MKAMFNRPFTLRAWHVAAFVLALALLIGAGVVVWAQEGETPVLAGSHSRCYQIRCTNGT